MNWIEITDDPNSLPKCYGTVYQTSDKVLAWSYGKAIILQLSILITPRSTQIEWIDAHNNSYAGVTHWTPIKGPKAA